MVLNVEISSLVLSGVTVRDMPVFVAAFEAELARLMSSGDVPVSRRVVRDVPPLPRTSSASSLGRSLARSVHSGLMR